MGPLPNGAELHGLINGGLVTNHGQVWFFSGCGKVTFCLGGMLLPQELWTAEFQENNALLLGKEDEAGRSFFLQVL